MEPALKQRLVGAAVLVALAVIFLPMLVEGPAPDSAVNAVPLKMPAAPDEATPVRELPLVVPATPAAGQGTVTEMPTPEATPAATGASPAGPQSDTTAMTGAIAGTAAAAPSAAAPEATLAATLPSASVPAKPSAAGPAAAATTTATTPPVKPTLPAGAGMGDYIVSLGRYASAANADALTARLRAARLPVRKQAVALAGGTGYAVVLGPFADRVDAEQARLAALKVRGDLPARVIVADAVPATAAAKPAGAKPANQPANQPATSADKPAIAPPAVALTRPASIAQGFVVQLVAMADRSKADALRDRLRRAGITAYTEQVSSTHGVLSRVRAGPVATRAEAEQLQATIRQSFGIDGALRPYP